MEQEGFAFRLLSDTDHSVAAAYDAVKGPDERFPSTPRRLTYLIDPEGTIVRSYTVTDIAAHPAEVLDDLRAAASTD